jgi:ketosteroid isomerase-like protein
MMHEPEKSDSVVVAVKLANKSGMFRSRWSQGQGDLVDGDHFFDIVTDDVVYEVLYDFPGWPRVIQGRAALMGQFRGYVDNIALQSADKPITHKTDDGRVVVLEYEVHGTILATGAKYTNRFCSIIKTENRKIAHWRDYMDSLAAWNALTTQNQS